MNVNRAQCFSKTMVGLLLAMLAIIPVQSARADAAVFDWWNALPAEPQLSADGLSMSGATHPPVLLLVDPNPPQNRPRVSPRDYLVHPQTATANFQFTYIPDGQTDEWGERCYTFPEAAKVAVERAGVIWGNILQSSVPITVRLCWINRPGNVLGYSGGAPLLRDFPNAPRPNTWFQGSLANSLAGSDLDPNAFDMHIAMNGNFSWYLGLDANPPSNQVDFVTVMLHEIAHGLNFAGLMQYSGGTAQWGFGTGSPSIYDVYMRDGSGNQIIDTNVYPNPSTALGSAVTSNNLWFHGTNAMAANSGQRVKMYAPSTWAGGSSYSHLDYATFSAGPNRLMVYQIAFGDAVHDPGTITIGLLKDLYWQIGSAATYTLTVNSSGASGVAITANPPTYGGTTNYTRPGIASGASITLTAPATSGTANFSSWSGCDSPSDNSCTVAMTQDRTVTANYTADPCPELVLVNYMVTGTEFHEACRITAGPDFTVTATGDATFRAGQRITLRPDFAVRAGGQFRAQIEPGLASPTAANAALRATPTAAANLAATPWLQATALTWSDLPKGLRTRLRERDATIRDAQQSADGAVIVFATETALVWNDDNAHSDVYAYAADTDTLWLISANPRGAAGAGPSHTPRLDGEGRHLLYLSVAPDLVAGPSNEYPQIYHHDLGFGTTARLTRTAAGQPGAGASEQPLLAGPWAIYRTEAPDLAPEGPGLYRQHLHDGRREAVGLDDGSQPDPRASHPAADAAGDQIAYQRPDPDDRQKIYLTDLPWVERLSLADDPNLGPLDHCCAALSADGRYLVYREQGGEGPAWLHLRDRNRDRHVRLPWPAAPALVEQAPRFRADAAELWWLAPEQGPDLPEVLHRLDNPLHAADAR